MEGKKEHVLAIVGIGEAGLPIIYKAREMNVKTVGFGLADSLGKDLVDIFVNVSIFDIDGMYKAALECNVSGVIGPSEVSTEPAAILADRLGLPGNSVKDGFFARNKYLMRKRVSCLTNVKQPEFHLYRDDLNVTFPVVVKAVDSCGKQGVTLAKNRDEYVQAVFEAKKFSSDESALIEEYISVGQEYSVECLANGMDCYVVQITEKDSSGPPHFAETGHHQPANVTEDTKMRIENVAKDILNILGITCGMAHLEIKICKDDIYFIEVGARGGGSHIADILTVLSTDCDYYKSAIECSLGIYKPEPIHNVAFSGMYYHIVQNQKLDELFKLSKSADWTYQNTVSNNDYYPEAVYYLDRVRAGYLIYCSDHKISMKDVVKAKSLKAERINDHPKAFDMLWKHNHEIGRELSDRELTDGINKFLKQGNVIAVLDGEHIIGFLNLYCNNLDTLSAYINNVYVLEPYRRCGLSRMLMDKAISICKEKSFREIRLHVQDDNLSAISLYKSYGFEFTGERNMNDRHSLEMRMALR